MDKAADHKLLHTGQNYDANLNDVFFQQLGIRSPDWELQSRGSVSEQMSTMFVKVERCLKEFEPDAVLILGDTNSGLAAIVCERQGIPVYHMEAGNRCYDRRVPEEINRRLIDSISTVNLPYTELSRQNLLREGAQNNKVFVVGNPIKEVIDHYQPWISTSTVLDRLGLQDGKYVVATAHRAENVDDPEVLAEIIRALETIAQGCPVIFSCHPRTRARLASYAGSAQLTVTDPMGFLDWAHLEQHAAMAISDSGTVQEEMCLFRRPTVTIRQVTERPETVWCGSNIVAGTVCEDILAAYQVWHDRACDWQPPCEYLRSNVSDTVVNILMGYH